MKFPPIKRYTSWKDKSRQIKKEKTREEAVSTAAAASASSVSNVFSFVTQKKQHKGGVLVSGTTSITTRSCSTIDSSSSSSSSSSSKGNTVSISTAPTGCGDVHDSDNEMHIHDSSSDSDIYSEHHLQGTHLSVDDKSTPPLWTPSRRSLTKQVQKTTKSKKITFFHLSLNQTAESKYIELERDDGTDGGVDGLSSDVNSLVAIASRTSIYPYRIEKTSASTSNASVDDTAAHAAARPKWREEARLSQLLGGLGQSRNQRRVDQFGVFINHMLPFLCHNEDTSLVLPFSTACVSLRRLVFENLCHIQGTIGVVPILSSFSRIHSLNITQSRGFVYGDMMYQYLKHFWDVTKTDTFRHLRVLRMDFSSNMMIDDHWAKSIIGLDGTTILFDAVSKGCFPSLESLNVRGLNAASFEPPRKNKSFELFESRRFGGSPLYQQQEIIGVVEEEPLVEEEGVGFRLVEEKEEPLVEDNNTKTMVCPKLRSVDLSRSNHFGDEGSSSIAEVIVAGAFRRVEYLDMSHNGIRVDGVVALSLALASGGMPQLRTFLLAGNEVCSEGARALTEEGLGSGQVPRLESIDVSHNHIGKEGALCFASLLRSGGLRGLRRLNLSKNGRVGPDGVRAIMNSLLVSRALAHANNAPSSAAAVAYVNPAPTPLLSLELAGIDMGDEGADAVSDFLSRGGGIFQTLETLDLSDNFITETGMERILKALLSCSWGKRSYDRLVSLNVSSNTLDVPSAQALGKVIAINAESLASLDISYTDVGEHEMEALVSEILVAEGTTHAWDWSMQQRPLRIARLNIGCNKLGSEGARHFSQLLSAGLFPSLVSLDVSSNEIGDQGAVAIGLGLDSGMCPLLEDLYLNDNDIGPFGLESTLLDAGTRGTGVEEEGDEITVAMPHNGSRISSSVEEGKDRRKCGDDCNDTHNEWEENHSTSGHGMAPHMTEAPLLSPSTTATMVGLAQFIRNRRCPRLKRLNFADNILESEGARSLGMALLEGFGPDTQDTPSPGDSNGHGNGRGKGKGGSFLESLHLGKNDIDSEGFSYLARAFQEGCCEHLRELMLDDNQLGPIGAQSLMAAVLSRRLQRLRVLDLFGNQIGPEGMQAVKETCLLQRRTGPLELHHHQHHMSEGNMGMGTMSAVAGSSVDSGNCKRSTITITSSLLPNLNRLDLSRNELEDNGVSHLAGIIYSGAFPSLQSLSLSSNDIRVDGVASLGEALVSGRCPLIQSIDLSRNTIGPEGLESFQNAMIMGLKEAQVSGQTEWGLGGNQSGLGLGYTSKMIETGSAGGDSSSTKTPMLVPMLVSPPSLSSSIPYGTRLPWFQSVYFGGNRISITKLREFEFVMRSAGYVGLRARRNDMMV